MMRAVYLQPQKGSAEEYEGRSYFAVWLSGRSGVWCSMPLTRSATVYGCRLGGFNSFSKRHSLPDHGYCQNGY
jgi:hypothetical protein